VNPASTSRAASILAILLAAALFAAAPAHALKVATYNMMAYENPGEGTGTPSPYISVRQQNFRTIMAALDPDVLITEEMNSAAAKDSFLLNVLGNTAPGQWAATWLDVSGTSAGEGMGIFWKPAKVSVSNQSAISDGGPRKVLFAVVKPNGYVNNTSWFRIYGVHFKAGSDATSATTRGNEAASLRTTINAIPSVKTFLVGGDTNIYDSSEAAYQRLTESQGGTTGNVGRSFDYLTLASPWHEYYVNAAFYTQCPCLNCTTTGQSGGGMDDRFDLLLTSASLQDGVGLDYVPGSYTPFGNDGLAHYNDDINATSPNGPNTAVPQAVADALHDAADHIPVMIQLQLPAKYVVASQLSFGDVIVGATAQQTLAVGDGPAPTATLNYTLAASAGFTAPGGSFNAVGGATNLHTLGMDASVIGARNGTVTLASNDNDTTSKAVLLDGRVLAHAAPSLDSATVVTSSDLDWGTHDQGAFSDQSVTVFDQGYNPLQARLTIAGASISGDSRFTLPGSVDPVTFGSPGVGYPVHFDDSSVVPDSTYSATLTFTTHDEALPGGTALTPLTVTLHAHVNGSTGVESPLALRFFPPSPNPAHAGVQMGYDLPRPAHVSVGVFDLSGRRVARLAEGTMGEGHHALRWDAQDDAGNHLSAGLYFVRFETPGLTRIARLAVLP
jgi:hypothetical protein